MTNSTDSIGRLISTVRTDLKTWPQLLPLRDPAPAGHPSRDFTAAFFLSVFMHVFIVFIAFLLWVVTTDPIAVEPAVSSIDTPLIVSLSTPARISRKGPDNEAVPAVPQTGPPARRESETEIAVISKDRSIRDSEAFKGESPAAGATQSFNLEAASRMASEFGSIPEFRQETVAASKGQRGPGSETSWGNSLAAYSTPAFGLEAADRIDRVFGKMSEFEVQDLRFKTRKLYIKSYLKSYMAIRVLHPDCRTAHAHRGLFAVPYLIRDAVTDNGCRWWPELREIE